MGGAPPLFRSDAGGLGGVYAVDFSAVLMLADAMGALNPVLIESLPELEPIIVWAYKRDTTP